MEDQNKLIADFNTKYETSHSTISEIYYEVGSTRMTAELLKVTPATITNWVRAEGGFIRDRGGANRKSKLYAKVKAIPIKELYRMQYRQLAEKIGSNVSWAGALKRRRMMEVL